MRHALSAALLTLLPVAALAHAHLRSVTPAAGSTVRVAPTEIVIEFTEAVDPSACDIVVLDPLGVHVEVGAAFTAPGDDKRLVMAVKPLAPGSYEVRWHATAVDSHRTDGTFGFTVAFTIGG